MSVLDQYQVAYNISRLRYLILIYLKMEEKKIPYLYLKFDTQPQVYVEVMH